MKTLALIFAAAAVLGASPAFAEESLPSQDSASSTAAPEAQSAAHAGPANLCSKEDPYIEYRDCVNASTRDSNAKVRDA